MCDISQDSRCSALGLNRGQGALYLYYITEIYVYVYVYVLMYALLHLLESMLCKEL
jgi:hypothetical protein